MALLLFDIDGTLLAPLGIGKRAFMKALEDHYPGLERGRDFHYDGLLDPQIVRMTHEEMGLAPSESEVRRLLDRYLHHLEREPPPHLEKGRCPGVPEVLDEARRRGHVLGLLTGNVRRGALIKLGHIEIGHYFEEGAFGDDAEERSALVSVALDRCRRPDGSRFELHESWIIGDSPRDAAAAREGGIRCVLVGTGITPYERLAECEPDLLMRNLSDSSPLWRAVEGMDSLRREKTGTMNHQEGP